MTTLPWMAAILTLLSVYYVGRKQPAGHLVGLAGSLLWVVVAWGQDWALVALNAAFVVLYLKNWIAWRTPS